MILNYDQTIIPNMCVYEVFCNIKLGMEEMKCQVYSLFGRIL